jgi:hypothetical protein
MSIVYSVTTTIVCCFFMKNEDTKEYRTSDFYIASFLIAKGFKVAWIDKTNPKRYVFIFQDTADWESLVDDYLYRQAVVEPQAFANAIKELKQFIYRKVNENENYETENK